MYAAVHASRKSPRLFECAAEFSPWVEQTSGDTVVISVAGLRRLFGSAAEIGAAIARRAAELGLDVSVALAPNPDLAVHGALALSGVTVMQSGKEACLPLEVLAPPPGIAETLALWGIRTFGEFAALPEDGVAERLGEEGARLQKLARGEGDRPLAPSNPPPPFEAALELEYPVTLLEPLGFVLGRLLNELCAHLEGRGLATHELRLSLALEGAAPHQRVLRLPYPMRDTRTFLKLLTLDLERHPPAAPIAAVSLTAEPVNPRVVQHGLFIPLAPEPQKLELTLARIEKLVGEGNVGAAEPIDTHRPRAFRMRHFVAGEKKGATSGCPLFLLRCFRPARPARVEALGGRPARVTAAGVCGRVIESAGPWRSSGDWWLEDGWSREEWDVALSDGALYLVYRDRFSGGWFVEGAYD
jgi:protein ImuB